MAAPPQECAPMSASIAFVGIQLNKRKTKKSKFFIRGSDLNDSTEVRVNSRLFTWKADNKGAQDGGTRLKVEVECLGRAAGAPPERVRETDLLSVTVTNDG